MSLFEELKRRNVIRMALLYVVASWVVLQIADVLFDPLNLPAWAFRLVLGLLLLGFPFALIFAWVFELTPEGLKREKDVDPDRSVTPRTGQKMNTVIVVLLVVAIAGLTLDRLVPERTQPPAPAASKVVEPEGEAVAIASEPENSIAVLPFINMSGDPDNEYFSDGLTEELLNTLVRIGGLQVTGRTSSFAFKGKNVDLREIGRLLNVANVLEGSVRKAGNRVRITAQLVKASDGYHLWSDTFDRELTDIFAVQEEIADQVTEAMHITLLGQQASSAPAPAVIERDAQAYEEYLRGMYIWQREPDLLASLNQSRERFEASLAIDDQPPEAYWGLFLVWDRMHRNAHAPFEESLAQMQYYAGELQSRAPDSDRALSAAARLALVGYDLRQAAAYLQAAEARFPANVEVLTAYANTLAILARYGNAIEMVERAERLDPLSLDVMRIKSFILYRVGDCQGVEAVMARAEEIQPNVARFRYYFAMCLYETTGDVVTGLPFAEAEPLDWAQETALAILYQARGDGQAAQEKYQSMLDRAGVGASYQFAQIHAQWGNIEQALDWLATGIKVRDPGIMQAGDDRLLAPLRGHPRFEQMLHEIGLR